MSQCIYLRESITHNSLWAKQSLQSSYRCAQSLMSCVLIIPYGPAIPTSVPMQTKLRSTHLGHSNELWISFLCIPNECPKHSVNRVVPPNSKTESNVTKYNPATAPKFIPNIYRDFFGSQKTLPFIGSDSPPTGLTRLILSNYSPFPYYPFIFNEKPRT